LFRGHFIIAINLDEVEEKGIQDKVLKEKQENLESWRKMEQLSRQIKIYQPCELTVIGDKIDITNFDMHIPELKNSKYDEIHTLSVISIKK